MENFSNDKKIISLKDYKWAAKNMNKIIGPFSFPIVPEYLSKKELREIEKERKERLEYLILYREMILEYQKELLEEQARQKEIAAAKAAKAERIAKEKAARTAARIEKTRAITDRVKKLFTFGRTR